MIFDLWPWSFGWLLKEKKYPIHGYTLSYQISFRLVQLSLRYEPKHESRDCIMTFDLWPWHFGWPLKEQKISHSWFYTIIPNFIQIGQTTSEIQAANDFKTVILTFDPWPGYATHTDWIRYILHMVVHHHTKPQWNWSSSFWDMANHDFLDFDLWPVTLTFWMNICWTALILAW